MRIVIVLQGVQKDGYRQGFDFVQQLCCSHGEHEIILAVDGLYPSAIEALRGAFDGIISQENIRLWYAHPGFVHHSSPGDDCQQLISRVVHQGFLASLKPDIVLLTGVIEDFLNCMGSLPAPELLKYRLPIVLLLPAHPLEMLSKVISSMDYQSGDMPFFFLTRDGLARKEWLHLLNVDERRIEPLSEYGNESLECQVFNALKTLHIWQEQSVRLSLTPKLPRRQKLAYVSPLPPQRSGISDYSADLLPELYRQFDIDVIVDQEEVSNRWIVENCPVRTSDWLRGHADCYDHVLYHVGNSHFHNYMFDLLDEVPGIVVLHDFFLSDLFAHRDYSDIPFDSFASILYRSHGYKALTQLSSPAGLSDVVTTYPCNFDVLRRAQGVIVHSMYARMLAAEWYGQLESNRFEVIPLLRVPPPSAVRAHARKALCLNEHDLLVCSFGMPGPYKLNHRLLETWLTTTLATDDRCTLLFVGEIHDQGYSKELLEMITNSCCGTHIRMTGWLPMEEYRLFLAAADIGVQLRTHSRGETSAAVLDCMSYGVATIVNANGSMMELPEECVMMLPDNFTSHDLKDALETLHNDIPLRRKVGENARAYLQTFHVPSRIAEQYAIAIERFACSPEKISNTVLKHINQHKTMPTYHDDLEGIAHTFSVPVPAHQLFIDVSELILKDLKTGIQRVVRSVLMELLEHPPDGFRIEPVFVEINEHGFQCRYARQFSLDLFSISIQETQLFHDNAVEIHPGDIFLGLDLCYTMRFGKQFFEEFRNIGGRLYFVVYDLLPCFFPQYFHPGIDKEHNEWMEIAAQGDGVICISRSVAHDVKEWFDRVQPHRYRSFNIGWVHLGADIQNSLPTKGFFEGFYDTLAKLAKAPTILMVGTVEPRKGHLQALKACEMLWLTGMKVNLVIVGKKGWRVEQLANRLTKHRKLNKQLFWYQDLSDEALQKLYETANGVLMASVGEGFGLPLIEAAQHGCPILARDLPVFREVAGDHATYFSGESPLKLAKAIQSWIKLLKKGLAPQSSGMPWLSWKESTAHIVSLLTDNHDPQWIYKWNSNAASVKPQDATEMKSFKKSPKCIAVDLTLVLPGGENGGAKVFLLELLLMLARMKPKTRFIILTRESSHKELAFLDRRNMRRVMILADSPLSAAENNRPGNATSPAIRISAWAERTIQRWKRSVMKRIKRREIISGNRLQDMGVDLFYCPFTSLDNAEAGIPTVCTIHDLQYKSYPEFFSAEEVALRDRMFIDACQRSTFFAAISEYSRHSAITHGDIDPERVRTIYHRMAHRILPDNRRDKESNDNLFGRLHLEKQHYILYPANFWLHKNHNILLTAFEIAASNGLPSQMKLVCTGAPSDRQRILIEKVQSTELAERVIFPGYLPNYELAVLLSNCTCMIFPSLYEGFGLPVIEAMAAGVPVACSNTRALPEITSGAALLFDPESPDQIAEAMVSITKDQALRKRLIEAGFFQAQKFSDHERMAKEYWALFEDAITPLPKLPNGTWAMKS